MPEPSYCPDPIPSHARGVIVLLSIKSNSAIRLVISAKNPGHRLFKNKHLPRHPVQNIATKGQHRCGKWDYLGMGTMVNSCGPLDPWYFESGDHTVLAHLKLPYIFPLR